jgi:hypothetical protein
MKLVASILVLFLALPWPAAHAGDELVTLAEAGDTPTLYVLTTAPGGTTKYGVIMMPGGKGVLNLSGQGSNVVIGSYSGSFTVRTRGRFADQQFVAAVTDSTSSASRIMAIVRDLERRYGKIAIYVIGTSSSTESTMSLASKIDGQVAGFVHTSSMPRISGFDPRQFKSRHLIVYHRQDPCPNTRTWFADSSHRAYGTELIVIEGGKDRGGDPCEGATSHTFEGAEQETVDKIKEWIVRGR